MPDFSVANSATPLSCCRLASATTGTPLRAGGDDGGGVGDAELLLAAADGQRGER